MPDAPTPTLTLAFAIPAAAWEAAQASVTGAETAAPARPREPGAPIATEFAAVDVTAGAETIRLEGPGATLEVGPGGMFRVGRRVSLPFVAAAPGESADTLEVTPAMACVFLGLLRHFGWPATAGTAALRALYEAEESIPEEALGAMAAGVTPVATGPEPAAESAPEHDAEPAAEPAPTDGAQHGEAPAETETPAQHETPEAP